MSPDMSLLHAVEDPTVVKTLFAFSSYAFMRELIIAAGCCRLKPRHATPSPYHLCRFTCDDVGVGRLAIDDSFFSLSLPCDELHQCDLRFSNAMASTHILLPTSCNLVHINGALIGGVRVSVRIDSAIQMSAANTTRRVGRVD
jgi:hypothetical protein